MKQILIILFFLPLIIQAQKPILVPINAGTLVKRDTANGMVAQSPLTIVSGGSSHVDTVKCETCGTSAGTVTGTGLAVRLPAWRSTTALTYSPRNYIDTVNGRIGFGMGNTPTTISLDSTASVTSSVAGISFYNSRDSSTNYSRGRIYKNAAGGMIIQVNEVGGTNNNQFNHLYLNSTSTSGAYVTVNGGSINAPAITATGTLTGATTIGTEMRWTDSRSQAGINGSMKIGNFSTFNASSGQAVNVYIGGTSTQTGTAGLTAFRIGMLYSTQGSGTYNLIEAGSNSNASGTGTQTNVFTVNNVGNVTAAQYRLSALNAEPSSASDTGTLGEVRITSTFIYVCTATNTWVRAALATW